METDAEKLPGAPPDLGAPLTIAGGWDCFCASEEREQEIEREKEKTDGQ